jgi:hypothetical protein
MTPAIDVGHRVALQAAAMPPAPFFGRGHPRARALAQLIVSDSRRAPATVGSGRTQSKVSS